VTDNIHISALLTAALLGTKPCVFTFFVEAVARRKIAAFARNRPEVCQSEIPTAHCRADKRNSKAWNFTSQSS
jgi:hypothetical protein